MSDEAIRLETTYYVIRWTGRWRARTDAADAGLDGCFETLGDARVALANLATDGCLGTLTQRRDEALDREHSSYSLCIVRVTRRPARADLHSRRWMHVHSEPFGREADDTVASLRASRGEARVAALSPEALKRAADHVQRNAQWDGEVTS